MRIALFLALASIPIAILARREVLSEQLLEGWLLLAVLFPLVSNQTVLGVLKGVGVARRLLVAGLCLSMLGAHLFGANLFPFVPWRMYGHVRTGNPVVYEYRAELRDGQSVQLVPSRLLPGITGKRVSSELIERLEALRTAPNEANARTHRQPASTLLITMARIYNRSNPDNPSEAVLVFGQDVRLEREPGEDLKSPSRFLWRLPVQ